MNNYATGADASTIDLRDFSFVPTKANIKGGQRYEPEYIQDQHAVGICTAISLTQNLKKATGFNASADFQYLIQKLYYDKNWNEGSSARASLHCAKTYGFLPAKDWTLTTEQDRKLPYSRYIAKLQAISDNKLDELLTVASQNKLLTGYANVAIDRDLLAKAIDESKAGLIVRFVLDNQWWKGQIEPLRKPLKPISGHLITLSNYDGMSYRVANSWGVEWADKGTAYGNLLNYQPTEAWLPYYTELPAEIEKQKKQKQIIVLLQKIIGLLKLKK